MKVGLIDVDGHNYPNLPLMKISAWHKQKGDSVEWYSPLFSGHMDIVYMSKVFSFSPDYEYYIDAEEIRRGGTGYAITTKNNKECYSKQNDKSLADEIEHIYPDYSLYPEQTKDRAFGFLTRGCPRGCDFCHVKEKEGKISRKVANLEEFWRGQKFIELLDPNLLACPDWEELLGQLIESKARVNFNQGLDIRMMTEKKAKMLAKIKLDRIHFAWDRYEDKEMIQPKFLEFRKKSTINSHKLQVYVLCGDQEQRVRDEDLERVYWLRDNGFAPYIMLYNKEDIPKGHELRRFQRFVNNRIIFYKCRDFKQYESR